MRGAGLHRSVLPVFSLILFSLFEEGPHKHDSIHPYLILWSSLLVNYMLWFCVGDICKPFFFVSSRQRLSLFFVSSVSAQSGLNNRCQVQILGGILSYSLCINGSYFLRNRSFEEYSRKANKTSRANTVSLQKC